MRRMRWLVITGLVLLAACSSSGSSHPTASPPQSSVPPAAATGGPIRHVFVIVLENESSSSTFGNPAEDPYLATTLPAEGALLPNYYAVGHVSLDNYIALISGQPPNPDTSIDCFAGYATFPEG